MAASATSACCTGSAVILDQASAAVSTVLGIIVQEAPVQMDQDVEEDSALQEQGKDVEESAKDQDDLGEGEGEEQVVTTAEATNCEEDDPWETTKNCMEQLVAHARTALKSGQRHHRSKSTCPDKTRQAIEGFALELVAIKSELEMRNMQSIHGTQNGPIGSTTSGSILTNLDCAPDLYKRNAESCPTLIALLLYVMSSQNVSQIISTKSNSTLRNVMVRKLVEDR